MTLLFWIWSQPQTLIGWIMSLFVKVKFKYKGCIVCILDKGVGGVSLGKYIFITKEMEKYIPHEYGHAKQSLMLGILYLPIIGLVSMVWATWCYFKMKALKETVDEKYYYRMWCEKWANKLGE